VHARAYSVDQQEDEVENITSGKLFNTRQGTITLGVIAAVIAAIALILYLQHYKNSVNGGGVVSVLVAQKLIQEGTSGDVLRTNPGYYKVEDIAKSNVETGAIVDPATLSGTVVTATGGISVGQQLTEADFSTSTSSVVNQPNANQRAVVISLGSPQQVGGQIVAGSHVDVWVSLSGTSDGVTRPVTRLLYQDMYVLGVNGGNVTMRATPTQTGVLIYAAQNSQIWLALRPTVATTPKSPAVGAGNLVH
jgi:Flp pilus assembly protein CpaB